MGLTVSHEPADVLAGDVVERCCLCRERTRYWYLPKDVALCRTCAGKIKKSDVPSKAQWIAKERALRPTPQRG